MDRIETRTAYISLHERNMVWLDFKKQIEIDANDIRENIAASLKLTQGLRHTAVLDTRGKDVSITNKAMAFGASREATRHRIATAHVTNSLSGRLFGNFFMKFFRPKIHNRMFTNDKEAVKWLRTFSESAK